MLAVSEYVRLWHSPECILPFLGLTLHHLFIAYLVFSVAMRVYPVGVFLPV